jgi:hypothetical protein
MRSDCNTTVLIVENGVGHYRSGSIRSKGLPKATV